MSKQSKWTISKALHEAGVKAEIREDGHVDIVFPVHGASIDLSLSDDAAIDIALAILDGKLSEIPSETELRTACRVLRGKAVCESGRLPRVELENASPFVNAILAFMERQTEWRGKTEVLLKAVSSQEGSPNWKYLSTRVFAHRINESRKAFRFFDLFIETFRRNDGSYVRMHWLGQSDAGDAGDAGGRTDEEREALRAMADLRAQENGMEN